MLRTKNKLLLMALTGFGLAAGLLVDVAVARVAGATAATDNLVIALTVLFVVDTVLREGARYSIISIIHESEDNGIESQVVAIAAAFFFAVFLVALIIFNRHFSDTAGLHYPEVIKTISAMAAGLFAYSAFLAATADANNYFVVSSCRNVIVHATALVVFLALNKLAHVDILSAVLAAYFIGALAYAAFVSAILIACGVLASVKRPTRSTLKKLSKKFLPSLINVGAGQGMRVAERGFLLPLPGGAVFLFYIGFRIFASLQALIGGTLAALAMRSNKELLVNLRGFKLAVARAATQSALYTIPCALTIIMFGRQLIELAYGKKLTAADIGMVYHVTVVFSLVIFFQTLNVIVTTFWLGQRRTFLMNVSPVTTLLLSIPALWFFSSHAGVFGVAQVSAALVIIGLVLNLSMLYIQIRIESNKSPL